MSNKNGGLVKNLKNLTILGKRRYDSEYSEKIKLIDQLMKLQNVLQNVVLFQLTLLKNHIFSVVSLFNRECDIFYYLIML